MFLQISSCIDSHPYISNFFHTNSLRFIHVSNSDCIRPAQVFFILWKKNESFLLSSISAKLGEDISLRDHICNDFYRIMKPNLGCEWKCIYSFVNFLNISWYDFKLICNDAVINLWKFILCSSVWLKVNAYEVILFKFSTFRNIFIVGKCVEENQRIRKCVCTIIRKVLIRIIFWID